MALMMGHSMDTISTGIGIGGILIALATLVINSFFRNKVENRAEQTLNYKRNKKQMELICHNNQARVFELIQVGDRRQHDRIDKINDRISELSIGIGEINGKLESINHSVNGGLESRIAEVLKAVMSGR